MESAWLESFIALCEHQSFTRAAAAQHMSQPAFSRRIRSLEKWIGTELFDRSTFPVALTDAGVSLRAEAVGITESLSGLRDRVRGVQPVVDRSIHVATSHTLAAYFFPGWWQTVTAGSGRIRCQLSPMDTFDAYDALVNGGCDLLLTHSDPLQPIVSGRGRIEAVTVATDEFGPYGRVVEGRLADRLPRAVGESVPLVAHGPSMFLGRITDRLLGEDRRSYRTVVQTDLTSAVANLVAAGVGVGWLPATVAGRLAAADRIRPIRSPQLTLRLDVRVHRRVEARSDPQLQPLWEAICSSAKVDR